LAKYISVQYARDGEYAGREYTYIDGTAEGVKPGDVVVTPTARGDNIARVSAVDVPEGKIDERVMPLIRTVERFAPVREKRSDAEPIDGSIDDL
jgi:hypothetical protein